MAKLPLPHPDILHQLKKGAFIPAHPLALNASRKLDERHQRALSRYYLDAGVSGLAVGVHTTQFAIRDQKNNLLRPVLELAAEEVRSYISRHHRLIIKVAGIVGRTSQALQEAQLATSLGYDLGLLNLSAFADENVDTLIQHCKTVAEVMPLFGFYLQPAVGGRTLDATFWRRFAEIENVVAIKIAPFNRYHTLDVLRGVAESGRADDIALYTGNDDDIIMDLLTPFHIPVNGRTEKLRIVGGLLGHWAVWTRRAVEIFNDIKSVVDKNDSIPKRILALAPQITDCNAAFFDAAHNFRGCIIGIHEVLRRQGLMTGNWTLDPHEELNPGQRQEIDRVYHQYPHLNDDAFVAEHLDEWLK